MVRTFPVSTEELRHPLQHVAFPAEQDFEIRNRNVSTKGHQIGILFVVNLAMLLLGLTRSAVVAAITPFVIAYCTPAPKVNVPGMAKILLLPGGLLRLGRLLQKMQFVGLESLRIPQAYALTLLYLPVDALLILGTYQLYQRRVV